MARRAGTPGSIVLSDVSLEEWGGVLDAEDELRWGGHFAGIYPPAAARDPPGGAAAARAEAKERVRRRRARPLRAPP